MIKTKVAFMKGRLLTSQSEQFKKLWLAGKKGALQKSHFSFDHVNRLINNKENNRWANQKKDTATKQYTLKYAQAEKNYWQVNWKERMVAAPSYVKTRRFLLY